MKHDSKTNWATYLGRYLVKEEQFFNFIVSSDSLSHAYWILENADAPQIDMALFGNTVRFCELKTTDSLRRKNIPYEQIKKYFSFREKLPYSSELWAYVKFREHDLVLGTKLEKEENCNFFITDRGNYVSQGLDPSERTSKRPEFEIKYSDLLKDAIPRLKGRKINF